MAAGGCELRKAACCFGFNHWKRLQAVKKIHLILFTTGTLHHGSRRRSYRNRFHFLFNIVFVHHCAVCDGSVVKISDKWISIWISIHFEPWSALHWWTVVPFFVTRSYWGGHLWSWLSVHLQHTAGQPFACRKQGSVDNRYVVCYILSSVYTGHDVAVILML